MNLDAARKRALILESDLNRLLIAAELRQLRSPRVWTSELVRKAGGAKSLLTLAAPLARLLSRGRGRGDRPSWLRHAVDGLKLAAPLGYLWRRRREKRPVSTT
ncbi:MAG: hypothetical protein H7A45_17275 [Verrucomicrobiales bacterium]|nr:hypothetical protein [Verrucomicrobiales bacterium]MCP5525597.1 hypothetical protein [Verrucomicrobiales bacterium]